MQFTRVFKAIAGSLVAVILAGSGLAASSAETPQVAHLTSAELESIEGAGLEGRLANLPRTTQPILIVTPDRAANIGFTLVNQLPVGVANTILEPSVEATFGDLPTGAPVPVVPTGAFRLGDGVEGSAWGYRIDASAACQSGQFGFLQVRANTLGVLPARNDRALICITPSGSAAADVKTLLERVPEDLLKQVSPEVIEKMLCEQYAPAQLGECQRSVQQWAAS